MKVNLGMPERIVRGLIGVVCFSLGLTVGRHAWWGILLDALGALLLYSATVGFCHVRKALSDFRAAGKSGSLPSETEPANPKDSSS